MDEAKVKVLLELAAVSVSAEVALPRLLMLTAPLALADRLFARTRSAMAPRPIELPVWLPALSMTLFA